MGAASYIIKRCGPKLVRQTRRISRDMRNQNFFCEASLTGLCTGSVLVAKNHFLFLIQVLGSSYDLTRTSILKLVHERHVGYDFHYSLGVPYGHFRHFWTILQYFNAILGVLNLLFFDFSTVLCIQSYPDPSDEHWKD